MATETENLINSLPPSLRAIIAALGLPGTVEFLRKKGGQHVYIPKHPENEWCGLTPLQVFNLRVQLHNVRLDNGLPSLINEHGGITLPKADKILIRLRDIEIRQNTHLQRNAQAAQYGLTVRQIFNIHNPPTSAEQTEIPWE